MAHERSEDAHMEAPLGQLEQSFIDDYLRSRGHDRQSLSRLPEVERERLWRDASVHASAKLSEVEARSHFLHELRDGARRSGSGSE